MIRHGQGSRGQDIPWYDDNAMVNTPALARLSVSPNQTKDKGPADAPDRRLQLRLIVFGIKVDI